MATGLEVQIGADTSDFNKKIQEVEADIKDLSKIKVQQIKLGIDTTEINAQIKDAKKSLGDLKGALKDSGSGFTGLAPKVANGGNALMQFSRIAQDAPFGIIGIGNNITATVESFGHLSQASGGAGNALKAVGASLLGPGGILLAISLVTTGLTVMAQKGLTFTDVLNHLKGVAEDFSRTDLNKAFASEDVVKATENVSQLSSEIKLAKEGFLNKDKVVKHYNETIGKTTGLVTNLSDAEAQLVKNGDAYIKMTLLKAAANIASQDAAKQTLEAEKSRQKKLAEFSNILLDADLTQIRSKEQYDAVQANLQRQLRARKQEEIKINQDAANKNLSIAAKFNEEAAKIAKGFNFNFFGDNKAPDKAKTKANIKLEVVSEIKPVKSTDEQNDKLLAIMRDRLSEDLAKFKNEPIVLNIPLQPIIDTRGLTAEGIRVQNILNDLDKSFNELIKGTIANTFAGLGEVIGNSIASGGNVLENSGEFLLGILGSFLTDFGKLLITTGTGLVLADLALKSGNGYAAIAAGVALVAIGSAFSAKSKALRAGGVSGGSATSGGSTGASYSSPASSSSYGGSSSSGGGGTVVFEIAGSKLIGVLRNTLDANKRLGGAITI